MAIWLSVEIKMTVAFVSIFCIIRLFRNTSQTKVCFNGITGQEENISTAFNFLNGLCIAECH